LAGLAVGFATLICLFGHLGAIGLLGPDEPRYAWIARAMAETGDWVTPRLYGSPWFEKPILYYWAAAIGFQMHLPPEWAARLPSALAALVATLGIAWLGWKHYGFEECPWSPALLAPLFFSTSVGAIGFSRAATPDMLFSASITLAMACAATILRHDGALRGPADPALTGHRGFTAILGFGSFLGLAVLAKGPAAIILAGGAIGIWALATKHWRAAFRMLHPFAIASFGVVALPWYVLCARRNPDFLRVFLFQHNFERYVSNVFQHRQPFWFFIPITLLALIPWTAFLIPAAREGFGLWRAKSWRDSPAFFFSCWAMFPILFFSFSQSKLPSYILPGIPALALVMAIGASRLTERSSRSNRWVFVLVGLTWIGLAAAAFFWATHRLPGGVANPARVPIVVCAVVAVIGGMLVALLGLARQLAALWVSLLLGCALVEVVGIAILPRLDPYYSARSVGAMLRDDLRPDRLFVYDLPRASQYGLAFYLGRQLPEWPPTDFDAALVLTTPKGFEELRARGLVEGALDESHQTIVMVPVRARSRGVPKNEAGGLSARRRRRKVLQEETHDLIFVGSAVVVGHIEVAEPLAHHLFRVRRLRENRGCVVGQRGTIVGLDEKLGNAARSHKMGGDREFAPVLIVGHPKSESAEPVHVRQDRESRALYLDFHQLLRGVVNTVERERGHAWVGTGHFERNVGAHVDAPESEMLGIDVVASRQRLDGGAQFGGFMVSERRHAGTCAVSRVVEQENVEFVLLQRGHERQHICTLRRVSVRQNYSGGAAQTGEKPALPLRTIGQRERKRSGMPHHHAQIERGGCSRGPENLVKKVAGNRGDRDDGEKDQRQQA